MDTIKLESEEEIPTQEPKSKPRIRAKPRSKKDAINTKTIKAPGTSTERVAQACDRCRAKKTRCDGKRPSCSSCAAIGIECIVSDKLSRRAFPKGYTEILEERIRQLESENKKLVGLLDLRDEQLGMLNGIKQEDDNNGTILNDQSVTSSNLLLLNDTHDEHKHSGDCPCGCANPHALHERPVSIAGSIYEGNNGGISIASSINLSDDDDNNSLLSYDDMVLVSSFNPLLKNRQVHGSFSNREVSPAPGAFAAATAIAQMQKNRMQFQTQKQQHESESSKQQLLTNLVALSIPRSTEETLFIPTLLARVCQVYGYNSKPPILTANAIASLKENSNEAMKNFTPSSRETELLLNMILNREGIFKLDDAEARYFICKAINLPASRIDLDQLISTYFLEWGSLFPVIDKISFLKNYVVLTSILDLNNSTSSANFPQFELIEKFGAILILMISLSLLANRSDHLNGVNGKNESVGRLVSYLNHYDFLIHEFIKPTCIITKHCSIQSLQILTLSFLYCLVIGDITTCYELRGRVISMAHQLRLHRCPAAVLGISGDNGDNINLQNFMQGERRILFWCIYSLDVYSSLNLGVPRLLKDFEIECAMPFSGKNDDDNDDDNENILIVNNTKLSIVGKVPRLALSFMQFCKVLGKILDSIFSRFENDDAQSRALDQDRMLDCWRRDLPLDLKFEIDINGFSVKDGNSSNGNSWNGYSKQQLTLVFLYYHAKILIYLPIISKHGNHHNVGLSEKEKLLKGDRDVSSIVSSISMIQQSSIQILEVLKNLSSTSSFLPIPINIAREQVRFALLVAMGSLDYIKGGPLYQNLKNLLLSTISSLSLESNCDIPGGLTKNSAKIFEFAVLSILGLNLNKGSVKKKSPLSNQPITKMAVSRDPPQQKQFAVQSKFTTNNNYEPTDDEFMNNIYMHSSNSSLEMENGTSNQIDDLEGLESILKFDPFKVKHSVNEFAADGSLGLVPFLDNDIMLNIYDNARKSDINETSTDHQDSSFFQWP